MSMHCCCWTRGRDRLKYNINKKTDYKEVETKHRVYLWLENNRQSLKEEVTFAVNFEDLVRF